MKFIHSSGRRHRSAVRHFISGATLLLLLTALIPFLAARGRQDDQSGNAEAIKRGELTFALDWTPNTNHTGLYVAQKLGYFTDEGLTVELAMPQSSVKQLVASGRAQLGIGFQEFDTSAIANDGIPVISVAAVIQHNTTGFTAMEERNIKRPRDFTGKLFAGWGNPFAIKLVQHLIQADGGDPEQFRSVTIGEAGLAGLLQDKVDYVWTFYAWENIGFDLQGLRTRFIPLKDLDPVFDYYTPTIITSHSFLEQHKDIAKRFIRAAAKGYEYAARQPDKAAGILLEAAPELDRELVLRSARYLAPFYVDENGRWGGQKPEVWDRLAAWMYNNGLIDKPLQAQDAMTNELLPE